MKRFVFPASVDGVVDAPPSKSMMIRAVAAAALSSGTSVIDNPSECQDAETALGIARSLGALVDYSERSIQIQGDQTVRDAMLDCGESGLCLRMFVSIASLFGERFLLLGAGSLTRRPVGEIVAPLSSLGVSCSTSSGFPPIEVAGPLRGGPVELEGTNTSQFLSGLIMALPVCEGDSLVRIYNPKSVPYLRMTIEMLNKFGVVLQANRECSEISIKGGQEYRATQVEIEGDYSGAAFLLVAGALAGRVKVRRLNPGSRQADLAILEALRAANARVAIDGESITAERSDLRAFEFDATHCPDLFPPLAALASRCNGTSKVTGVGRLEHKESDRARALKDEFGKMGVRIHLSGDYMAIDGSAERTLQKARVNSHNDHRIAMACAIGGLCSEGGVEIEDSQCVAKSYPGFFDDLSSLGAKVG